jgi:hypothetical protein
MLMFVLLAADICNALFIPPARTLPACSALQAAVQG